MAKILYANGGAITVEPSNKLEFELEELQAYVGGLIELVPLDQNQYMVINEEGKHKGLPKNTMATEIAHARSHISKLDWIVGDVVIINKNQIL